MKTIGLFKKTEDKKKILDLVRKSLKNCPKKWKEIPDQINIFGYYQDDLDFPSITINCRGVLLKIQTSEAIYVYGFIDQMKIGWNTPPSQIIPEFFFKPYDCFFPSQQGWPSLF
jgi:hypothetical protein